jgi:hypothetical protein
MRTRDLSQRDFFDFLVSHRQSFTKMTELIYDISVESRSRFGGDLDLMLVMQAILLRELQTRKQSLCGDADASYSPEMKIGGVVINASAISRSTRIPRETVRRKLKLLQEMGWITIDRSGDVTLQVDQEGMCLALRELDSLSRWTMREISTSLARLLGDLADNREEGDVADTRKPHPSFGFESHRTVEA